MCKISRNCDTHQLISLKFIEGHSTSRPYQTCLPASTFYSNIQLFRIHFSKDDCVFYKGEGGKLGNLSGALSYPTFTSVSTPLK